MSNTRKNVKAVWTSRAVQIFCDICASAVEKDMRPGTHLNVQGWKYVIEHFTQLTGMKYDKIQLKNKWDQLKADWKLWKELKGRETGLGWDSTLETVDAPADWWEAKISVNKEFAKFKKKGIHPDIESKNDIMFGQYVATGEYCIAPTQLEDPQQNVEAGADDFDDNIDAHNSSPRMASSPPPNPTKSSTRKKHRGESSAKKFREDISRLVASVESRHSANSSSNRISRAVAELDSITEIESGGEVYFFACDLLEHKSKREMWLSLTSKDLKLRWIYYQYNKFMNNR